jgi:hypothetical protein
MSDSKNWMYDYLQPENAKHFSNPRAEMRPEDYAPMSDWRDEAEIWADPPEAEDGDEDDD